MRIKLLDHQTHYFLHAIGNFAIYPFVDILEIVFNCCALLASILKEGVIKTKCD